MGVGMGLAKGGEGWGDEEDVTNLAQEDEPDARGAGRGLAGWGGC